ncbi:winged helix-turn-helix domain-containing protein [uncultured Tenacibaculum sp.]|uniref:winged helix-turn-helix domain-containing protein n=1 Tax=uncultured Tenacibaculum sp. TaxID=174713 RepID=UPI0026248D71|nr:winged helix-turn-helix domain-containing protein [uncultured Tenacibaculum sp.]
MKNNQKNNPSKRHHKDNKIPEKKTIFLYLQENIATASMISEATGISQKNITRHKRSLEKAGKLWEIEEKRCLITGCKAWYLSTNPNIVPNNNQLDLFGY